MNDAYQYIKDGDCECIKDPVSLNYYFCAKEKEGYDQVKAGDALKSLGYNVHYINGRAGVSVLDVHDVIANQSQSVQKPDSPNVTLEDLINPDASKPFNAYAEKMEIRANNDTPIARIGVALAMCGIPHRLDSKQNMIITTNSDAIIKIKGILHTANPQLHKVKCDY